MSDSTYRYRIMFADGRPDKVFEGRDGSLHLGDSRGIGARFTYMDGDIEWLSDMCEIRMEMSDGDTRIYSF